GAAQPPRGPAMAGAQAMARARAASAEPARSEAAGNRHRRAATAELRLRRGAGSVGGAARRLATDQPGLVSLAGLGQHRRLRVLIERRLVAPGLDQQDAVLVLLRQQHVELLAADLAARALRVPFDQLDELI